RVNERVLDILLERKASLSGIARASNTTKANVFRSLKALEEKDLVRKEILGKTHLYRFNFLHHQAMEIEKQFQEERRDSYNQKMNHQPALLNYLLENMLGHKYQGCIFFGSSLTGSYRDIDVFVMTTKVKEASLIEEIKHINPKISPTFGTKEELELGLGQEDMRYKNISNGIPFHCEEFILAFRRKAPLLKRKDIQERFILGYREILSCLEFPEKEYVHKHLKKGIMDIAYSALNYYELYPRNDSQAKEKFKKQFGFWFSNSIKTVKSQAEKVGELIL
ncbi:MAG: helix-turn-helix domain-containing protein, partial [Nanoarchaeota archaeon]